jgi:hypothetical protein
MNTEDVAYKKLRVKRKKLIIVEKEIPTYDNYPDTDTQIAPVTKKILTEDLGKIFEMAICLLYDTDFNGKYSYSIEEANVIKDKIQKLKIVFPYTINHIAKNGNKYDFVTTNAQYNTYLSAKTTKKNAKVCPQVIGQPSKNKFCEFFGIRLDFNLDQIKQYIESNVKSLLYTYSVNTFDCPIVYYNKHKQTVLFVKLRETIQWTQYDIQFSHRVKQKKWNESTSIIVNNVNIGEFQVHNHRDCIKFRWAFEKLLNVFKDNFEIIDLSLY